MMTSN